MESDNIVLSDKDKLEITLVKIFKKEKKPNQKAKDYN